MKVIVLLLMACAVFAQPNLEKAKALYEAKKYDEAEKLLKSISGKSGDYAAAQYYLGRVAFDKREYDDAAEYFEEATEVDSKQADYFNWLGNPTEQLHNVPTCLNRAYWHQK